MSDSEIQQLVNQLRNVDTNKLAAGEYRLNFQGHTTATSRTDQASQRLGPAQALVATLD